MLDGRFSNKHLELVYTKYEVNRSIIKDGRCIQPFNPVFSTLTTGTKSIAFYTTWRRLLAATPH